MHRGHRGIKSFSACIFAVALPLAFLVVAQESRGAGVADQQAAQIEYIAPNGQLAAVSGKAIATHEPSATFIDHDTISCALRDGQTTFIIELPKNSGSDRFVFLNENAAACGELRIAVSDAPLPANSPKWTEVDGIIPFAHKRLFKLSILGVETKFVRLSFKVEGRGQDSARISDPFRTSFLAAASDSKLSALHRNLDLHLITSVGALWTKQNQ